MQKWQSLIDQQLEEAHANGSFNNLPGTGKPLDLKEDSNTPNDMKLAYKILKDNDIIPDWMEEGKALEAQREKLVGEIRGVAAANAVSQGLRDRISTYNKRALTHNLKLPPGFPHKRTINLERELTR